MEDTQEYTACAQEALQTGPEEAEAVREEREEAYRVMADAMPQIVWAAQPDGARDYFNQRWYEHTAMTPAQTKGWGWVSALHPEDQERCREAWREAVQTSEAFEIEYRLLCAEDGSYRWQMERALPVFAPTGEIVKWFGTCTDIDDLKQAQAQIEDLNLRLRRAMTETHHRVKNNLQIISAMVDMKLMTGEETISAAEFKRLGAHIHALSAVHDILTRDAKAREQPEAISIREVLDKLLPVHQQAASHRHITARIEDIPLPGRHLTSLALVLNELMSNAIKHGRGHVEVVVGREESRVMVTVCDDGPGFPDGFDVKTAANTGLELVQSLVEWDMRGHIAFGNQPQGGAQVVLTLPLQSP
jgi:PAS domain S-box-containing protein